MKTAKEIIADETQEGEKQGFAFPESFALGVLMAKYDSLKFDYEILIKQIKQDGRSEN